MRILHLLQSPHFSGAENVVCQIINMFKEDKDIEMIYCSQKGTIQKALEERKIKYFLLDSFTIKNVKNAIDLIKPDIIHAHDRTASLVASLVCGKIPYISHIHYNAMNTRTFSVKALGYLFATIKAKQIFWVSQSSFDGYIFHDFLKKKSTILYNIIDIHSLYERMYMDNTEYNYDFIFIGRIVEQKNPFRLLEVCKLVVNEIENVKFALVGTGELEESMKIKAKNMGLFNNISFVGYKANPLKMLYDSKAMLMTSRFEGTPMCALEALALGVPIVSTPADGMKDLIINGENGYLSENNEVLAQKLIEIIKSPSIRQDLSNKAVIFSKEYNNIDKYKKIISEVYRK